jgi:hypothetical protein
MAKPDSASGYDKQVTENCERVLVTLLRGLGPWKDSVYLVGGLTPRYLAPELRGGKVPHAGTGDVDIVIQLEMLATTTDAYHSLEENLKKMGFEREENEEGEKQSWRWKTKTEKAVSVVLELLADNPELSGGQVKPLPTEGTISALNIPHSSMVFDHFEVKEIQAELLGENGVATENVRYADLVSFTCLKAFALDQRNERKDAHDIIFCVENADGGPEAAAKKFQSAREGKHAKVVDEALAILGKRFADDGKTEGYRKDGPVAVARFEIDGEGGEVREARLLRQRQVSNLIMRLLKAIG